jgi:hypothetical protein
MQPFHPRCTKKRRDRSIWLSHLFLTLALYSLHSPLFKRAQSLSHFVHLCQHCARPYLIALNLCLIVPFLGPIAPILCRISPSVHFSHTVIIPKWYEPSSYVDLFTIPEFTQCREVFLRAGWGSFLSHLQGHNDGISMQFTLGFDVKTTCVGSLTFGVSEESIAATTKLPRIVDRWFKNHQLPRSSYNRAFKPEFQNISGAKGYSKEWIKEELINPLIFITRLITCEGRYSIFKSCHFRLLAHFQFNKPLNFPLYFLNSLEKMSSQVRKNVTNPHNKLFHHGLIKLLVLAELEKQGKTWDEFIFQFVNPHLTIKTSKKTLDLRTISPSKPHSPKTPNPHAQAISLPEQKSKKLVDIPATSSGKKTKNPIANPPMPSTSLDPTPKNIQEVIQQDFPTVPTNRRGAN